MTTAAMILTAAILSLAGCAKSTLNAPVQSSECMDLKRKAWGFKSPGDDGHLVLSRKRQMELRREYQERCEPVDGEDRPAGVHQG